jgi:hypothetical protein
MAHRGGIFQLIAADKGSKVWLQMVRQEEERRAAIGRENEPVMADVGPAHIPSPHIPFQPLPPPHIPSSHISPWW